jgi:hypothetical protein
VKDFYAQEILSVYLLKDNKDADDDTCDIATKLKNEFSFDPVRIAIILTSVLDYCVDLAPESIQNEFEEETLRIFKEALEIRHEHIFKLDKHYE